MTNNRYAHIDAIRAFAIVGIIITHIISLQLGSPLANIIWNYLHFTVVGLVFCSAYVYAARYKKENRELFSIGSFWKRCKRLYLPFLIYLIVHYAVWFIFPTIFHGFGLKKSVDFVISSLVLTGGIDFGWLPLLFIQLAVVSPFLLVSSRKPSHRIVLWIFFIIWTLSTTILRIPDAYSRLVAWIPWSFILFLGFIYHDMESTQTIQTKNILINTVLIGGLSWMALYALLSHNGMSLTLTVHKYPPDLFYFIYGATITSVMLLIFPKHVQKESYGAKAILFLSTHAYTIFFLHYLVLDLLKKAN
jgi:hypothetical protein